MKSLGFTIRRHSKALYYDGHERADVVQRRKEYLAEMLDHEKYMAQYSGRNCEVVTLNLPEGARERVLVVHDESTFHTNDDDPYKYCEEGKASFLKRKDLGGGINVSAFLSEKCGVVRLNDEQWSRLKTTMPNIPQTSTVKMKIGTKYATAKTGEKLLGISHNGWWTNQLVLEQVKQMIPIFEAQHPGCQGVFQFDNSTGHNAYADDALLAHKMGFYPGGKQPRMRDTVWKGQRQSMVFEEGDVFLYDYQDVKRGTRITKDHKFFDVPKGSKQVCLERKLPVFNGRTKAGKPKCLKHCCKPAKKTEDQLYEDEVKRQQGRAHEIVNKVKHQGSRAVPCCCVYALSQCPDFMAQKNSVQELIEAQGHICIFLPKYHPELNYIERFWGHTKRWLRRHCLYTMAGLWDNIERAFSEEVTPLSLQRKFSRKSWRWMSAYRTGLSPELACFAARKYHGHRCVPPTIDRLIEELDTVGQKTDAKNLINLVVKDEACLNSETLAHDPTKMSPEVFVGQRVKKEFDGVMHEGDVVSTDEDLLGNRLFLIRYLDGDEEDMFLSELVNSLVDNSILLRTHVV